MTKHTDRIRRAAGLVVVALLATVAASCIDSDEPIIVEPAAGSLFDRYVSLGNSLTAGYQSGGINVDLQEDAYPVILAEKAGASFGIPALANPGCPPPLVGPLTTERVDTTVSCNFRQFNPDRVIQNLAVPGAATGDLGETLGPVNFLNTLILGGRTQLQAMADAEPSLVSVWIGANDALGAALGGDTLALTPLATFQSDYDAVAAAITASGAEDALLLSVPNPVQVAPALQPGAYFWALAQNPPPGLPTLNVSANCAPFDAGGNANPGGARMVSFVFVAGQIVAGADPVVIDCGTEAPGLVNETEMVTIATRVAAFNAYIEGLATANDWIYVDLDTDLWQGMVANTTQVRKCQDLSTATDAASFAAAVASSCPVDLDPGTSQTFYGSYFSYDGIHPSSITHWALANVLAAALNAKYTDLALPES